MSRGTQACKHLQLGEPGHAHYTHSQFLRRVQVQMPSQQNSLGAGQYMKHV